MNPNSSKIVVGACVVCQKTTVIVGKDTCLVKKKTVPTFVLTTCYKCKDKIECESGYNVANNTAIGYLTAINMPSFRRVERMMGIVPRLLGGGMCKIEGPDALGLCTAKTDSLYDVIDTGDGEFVMYKDVCTA